MPAMDNFKSPEIYRPRDQDGSTAPPFARQHGEKGAGKTARADWSTWRKGYDAMSAKAGRVQLTRRCEGPDRYAHPLGQNLLLAGDVEAGAVRHVNGWTGQAPHDTQVHPAALGQHGGNMGMGTPSATALRMGFPPR